MKALLLATVTAATFMAAPVFAQSGPVGSGGISYSKSEIDFGGLEGEADGYAIDGVVAVNAFNGWTATFAGSIGYDDDADDTALAGTAHLTRLTSSDIRLGGFIGATEAGDETAWTVGGEVQKYLANATLTGSVAYTTADDIDIDAWTIGGDAAFYVMPNLRLNAGAAYSNLDVLGTDADLWTYGVGVEYEISNTPLSVAAGYSRDDVEDVTIDTWTIGLRYSFGGTLQARDRAGATLSSTSVAEILGSL